MRWYKDGEQQTEEVKVFELDDPFLVIQARKLESELISE